MNSFNVYCIIGQDRTGQDRCLVTSVHMWSLWWTVFTDSGFQTCSWAQNHVCFQCRGPWGPEGQLLNAGFQLCLSGPSECHRLEMMKCCCCHDSDLLLINLSGHVTFHQMAFFNHYTTFTAPVWTFWNMLLQQIQHHVSVSAFAMSLGCFQLNTDFFSWFTNHCFLSDTSHSVWSVLETCYCWSWWPAYKPLLSNQFSEAWRLRRMTVFITVEQRLKF